MIVLTLIFFLALFCSTANASYMSTLAAALSPGQFVQMTAGNMPGFGANGDIMAPVGCTVANDQAQFANKAIWNPIAKTFQHVGSPHVDCTTTNVGMVIYTDSTDTWSRGPTPNNSVNTPQHSYDQNTIDPSTGTAYFVHYNSRTLQMLTSGGGSWTNMTPIRPGSSNQVAIGIAWFPDYQGGSVVWVDADWGIWACKPRGSSCTWTHLYRTGGNDGSGLPVIAGLSGYPAFASYSQLCQCVVFGRASAIHKINSDGSTTQFTLSSGPSSITIASSGNSSVTVDPVSGKVIVLQSGAAWELDPRGTGTWTPLSITQPGAFRSMCGPACSLLSAPISDYGVVMYVKCNDSISCSTWLYKHAAGVPNIQVPTAPTNLVVK